MPPQRPGSQWAAALDRARRRLGEAETACQDVEDLWLKARRRAEDASSTATVDPLLKLSRMRREAADECNRRAEAVRELEEARAEAQYYNDRYRFHHTHLQRQYSGLGYQYDLLVERAARAATEAERADHGGGHGAGDAQRQGLEAVLKTVAALQRYTEATKEEVIQRRVETQVVKVIEVFESIFRLQAPQLWEKGLEALKASSDERTG